MIEDHAWDLVYQLLFRTWTRRKWPRQIALRALGMIMSASVRMGARDPFSNRCFRLLIRKYKPEIFGNMEPRISGVAADNIIRRSGFDFSYRIEATGFSGGIWLMWNNFVSLDILAVSSQFIHARCVHSGDAKEFFITCVYASPCSSRRNRLWDQLKALEPSGHSPWVLGGDFNAICNTFERQGGALTRSGVSSSFCDFIFDSGVTDMGFNGPRFTWAHGSLSQRLDRFLCNGEWYNVFTKSEVFHLQQIGSDHRPLLLDVDFCHTSKMMRPFKYLNFQLRSKEWSITVFGHIERRKQYLLARIKGMEKALDRGRNSYLETLGARLKQELEVVLEQEESLWFQRARTKWINLGDRNTAFFHASTISRSRQNKIAMLKLPDGSWCDDQSILRNHALEFFRHLLTSEPRQKPVRREANSFVIPEACDTHRLLAEVSKEEVRSIVFDMDPLKALGVDGLHTALYQKNWDMVGDSIFRVVSNFFATGMLEDWLNQTLLVLIPKVKASELISQLRPINLCNVIYKIISKLIVCRLKPFLPKWIDQTHASFVPGRQITDNIILAQKVMHSMARKKGRVGWMALKVDLEKAYDRPEWDYIEETLLQVGLPSRFISLVMSCVRTVSTKVLWNCDMSESFKPTRGLRQGDPLSPYLFVICMERLSQAIKSSVHMGSWKPIKLSRYSPGHRISIAKTQIHFSCNCTEPWRAVIADSFGFQVVEDLGKYLGVPLLHKRVTRATYAYLLDKMRARLSGWAARTISLAGRITLAKSVLQAIPSYVMQTTWIPKSLCADMEKLIRRFLWGSSNEKRGMPLVKWEIAQAPMLAGGLGMKDLYQQNRAFLLKVRFQLISNPDKIWVQILRAKYGWRDSMPQELRCANASQLWNGLSDIWGVIKDGLCWSVRDGNVTDFWNDKWLDGEGNLASRCTDNAHALPSTVASMIAVNGDWDWNQMFQWLPADSLEAIAAIKPPRPNAGADVPGWRWESNRTFSVRSAYKALTVDSAAPLRIMTNAERKRRHLATSDVCASCQSEIETIVHVLRDCPRARQVWEAVVAPAQLAVFFSLPFSDWILQCVTNVANVGTGDERWAARFATICWLVWKQRCNTIFGTITLSGSAWVRFVVQSIDGLSTALDRRSTQGEVTG
ncbi:hypothetical protein GQ457_03G024220 [Hibiscus cannabinus]